MSASEPAIVGEVLDVAVGGLKAVVDRYVELFTRLPVALRVPVLDRDDDPTWTTVSTTAAVVRIEPDEEGDPGTVYAVSLSFSRLSADEERALALFLLQRLQIDPESELVR